MDYQYIAYNQEKRIIRGIQVAASADVAANTLTSHGYKVLTLKEVPAFLPRWDRLFPSLNRISTSAIITFSRQLALLHESGMDIVGSLELLKNQNTNRHFKTVLGLVISSIRGGEKLSEAMSKHPSVFPKIYVQSINVGEQTGNIETVLRQMADYMEKENEAAKSVKNAMKYPVVVLAVAVVVIAILVNFVLPSFIKLYSSLGANLPAITAFTISFAKWLTHFGLYLLAGILIAGLLLYIWGRTAEGKAQRDKLSLKMPLLGRVVHLNELIRCCRAMSLLYKAGLPVPEIIVLAVETSSNVVMKQALVQVHQDVLKGQGLTHPMNKNELFPPMMVQMVGVGEATGNLDSALTATADTYETEAEDRMRSIINMIQPAITIILGVIVAIIAMSLVSAMYSLFGQVS